VTDKHVNDPVPGLSDQVHSLSDPVPGLSDQVHSLSDPVPTPSDQAPEISQELKERLDALGQREHDERKIKSLIIALCSVRPMKRSEIARWLKRGENYVKNKFLKQMVADRQLRYLHPDMINHPEQAYLADKEKGHQE
jgi:ATP-dependent DNA helicase RecG